MARIRTCISWPATAGTRRSPARSAKAKKAGPRISSETRSCGSLLERGANPYDQQVVYNIHFNGKVLWFLETDLRARAANGPSGGLGAIRNGRCSTPAATAPARDGSSTPPSSTTTRELAEWCLSHGANPNSAPGPQRRNRQRSLYDEAMFRGHVEVAELLVRYGATRSSMVLNPMQRAHRRLSARATRRPSATRSPRTRSS